MQNFGQVPFISRHGYCEFQFDYNFIIVGGKEKDRVSTKENHCFDHKIITCSQKPDEVHKYRSQSGLRNAHCGLQYERTEQNS